MVGYLLQISLHLPHYALSISFQEKYMEDTLNTKFLGLQKDQE